MAANPSPPNLPGTPPVVDEFEAKLMREQAQSQQLLPEHGTPTRPRLQVVAGRKAGTIAGTAVNTVTQIRERFPVYRARTQRMVQERSAQARAYAYANPIQAVMGAMGAGFIVGFMLRFWRSHRG